MDNLPVDCERMELFFGAVYGKSELEQDAAGKWTQNKDKQRTTREGVPLWEITANRLVAGGRMIPMRVTIAAEDKPMFDATQSIKFVDLRASKMFTKKDGTVGIDFSARGIEASVFVPKERELEKATA
jgi:hypothetical protein